MDHHALVRGLVNEVRANTVSYLQTNQTRLTRCASLIERFDAAYRAWSEQPTLNARQITETINELLIAKQFLQDEFCASVEYEPPLDGSEKSIDFLFHTTKGKRIFYDVKTIHPEDIDKWERYQKATEEGWFTEGTQLIFNEAFDGGVLAHHRFAARQKFRDHTLELEEKIRHVPDRQDGRTFFRMVFCGDKSRWDQDQLEDFADTYLTGHSSWDHFAKMEAHDLKVKGLRFEKSIDSFCYFERRYLHPEPTKFECDVMYEPKFRSKASAAKLTKKASGKKASGKKASGKKASGK